MRNNIKRNVCYNVDWNLRQQKKELTLANAGHEPPLIYDNEGNFSNFEEAGPPLGIAPKFKFKETKINFSNSSMYIFTDGITEIKDTKGNMLESDGFKNYIKKYQPIPNYERLNKIVEDIIKSGRIQKDDLTIVVVDGLQCALKNVQYRKNNDTYWNSYYFCFILGYN